MQMSTASPATRLPTDPGACEQPWAPPAPLAASAGPAAVTRHVSPEEVCFSTSLRLCLVFRSHGSHGTIMD